MGNTEDKFVSLLGKTVWAKQANDKYLVGAELIEVDKEPIWKILDCAYDSWCERKGYITHTNKWRRL